MGILDQLLGGVLGQALGGGRGGTQAALIQAVIGMLLQGGLGGRPTGGAGGAGGGLSDVLGGLLRGGQPGAGGQPLGATDQLGGLLSGGLGGLTEVFGQAGMRQQVDSWIAQGPNMAVSPDQITKAFGMDRLGDLAAQAGMTQAEAAGQLAEILPGLVDRMTPGGAMPRADLGVDDFGAMMSGILNPRR
ncbi:MAG: DUF937 domain-containing protein [Alphaproteobacteria bacterium]|nr:DUF937 domain-containing protein [Alphaproteobacteria bacterium]